MSHLACAACQHDVFKMFKTKLDVVNVVRAVLCFVMRATLSSNPKELLRNCNSVKYIRDRLKNNPKSVE